MSGAEREAFVAFMLPSLESGVPLGAEIAYGAIAAAPYATMRT